MDLRTFTFGIMVGIAMLIGTFAFVSYIAGLKWQPVKVSTLSAAQGTKP